MSLQAAIRKKNKYIILRMFLKYALILNRMQNICFIYFIYKWVVNARMLERAKNVFSDAQ